MASSYTCLDCGAVFEEPEKYTERHGFDSPPYEEHLGCPYCGGAYTETIICDGCGEPVTADYVKIDPTGNCYCEGCYTLRTLGD